MNPPVAPRRPAVAAPPLWAVAGVLALVTALQIPDLLALPFVGDDYLFLDKTIHAGFGAVWAPRDLVSGFYRPWSRELHYWTMQRLFGPQPVAFHAANLALWLGILTLTHVRARALAGAGVAALTAAGVAALAAWAVLLVWAAGAQDLWMMLFALLFLELHARERWVGSAAALILALLCKETAAVLPGLAAAADLTVGRRGARETLARAAPLAAIVLVWAAVHPMLGGRLLGFESGRPFLGFHPSLATVATTTVLGLLNLDMWPAPVTGWARTLLVALAPAVLLVALVIRAGAASRGDGPSGRPLTGAHGARAGRRRVMAFGVLWAAIGWLPLAHPALGLHAYYGIFGMIGAWLAIAAAVAPHPRLGVALIAGIALLRPARADTPSLDWGTESYQRRSAALSDTMHVELMRLHPALAPHSRVFFAGVPGGPGLIAGPGNSPALRVWYGDPTLRGGFFSHYRPRAADDTVGVDLFLLGDSTGHWMDVVRGAGDPGVARPDVRWQDAHALLAETLYRAGDPRGARGEFEKLAAAFPGRYEYPHNAGACSIEIGDSLAAARWFDRAATTPGATARALAAAREIHAALRGRQGSR